MRLVIYLLLMLSAATISAEQSVSQQEVEEKLKALEAEISKFKELLESTETAKDSLEDNLEKNEKGISDLINKIEDIQQELGDNEDKVSSLTKRQTELLSAKSEQQYYIEQQIRAAYEIGNQEYLKVLLNQEDPNEMARMLTYYDYFNRARAEQISIYNSTLVDLNQVTLALAEEQDRLTNNKTFLVAEQSILSLTQKQKQKTLAALTRQIQSTGSELEKMQVDRGRLEELLDRIHIGLANLVAPADAEPFVNMQGKLVLPVTGKVIERFGKQRSHGKLKWQGVFIDADEGDPVHAVHYGRVVFSDWLRGFGLLLIISHGEGYMSLYGHNQVLYRQTGDWVTAGDVIATVGDSGGQTRTGLYFEIRNSGKPNDPQKWCMARQQRAA